MFCSVLYLRGEISTKKTSKQNQSFSSFLSPNGVPPRLVFLADFYETGAVFGDATPSCSLTCSTRYASSSGKGRWPSTAPEGVSEQRLQKCKCSHRV
ncbi:hypothetical protein JTE90_023224 [Oedothorax gibbosus]|uniref:Uncharacterized protein n=1 Tax=Oedothorax gibbosus TaxID=931172 RepID=A0AAV6VKX7_9ARAC|nr:hypothetical protein JTE90_023224 [Oedothorax gibbosus]